MKRKNARTMFDWTLTPAWGKKYKSVTDCRNDFYNGEDFIFNKLVTTQLGSIRDIPENTKVKIYLDNNCDKETYVEV